MHWENWEETKQKKTLLLEKEIDIFKNRIERIRGNRISLEMIRGLTITHEGKKTPIKFIGNLSLNSRHELVIQTNDRKALPAIIQTVTNSNLGLRLINSSKEDCYFSIEVMTREMKERLAKEAKALAEEGKASLRRVRDGFRTLIKKEKTISKDQKENYEREIDRLVIHYQNQLIDIEKRKIKELQI